MWEWFAKHESGRVKNLQVAFSKKLTKGWSAPSPSITGNEWAEGPTVAMISIE
jgi:hypothetical protein